jgi:hypothetical protein
MITTEQYHAEALRITEEAHATGLDLRLLGSLAFRFHCEKYVHLLDEMGRELTDIDFVGSSEQRALFVPFMKGLGYEINNNVLVGTEGQRFIFDNLVTGICIDIFVDKLDFCHSIWLKDRLQLDYPTVTVTDLLFEKMQIVEINLKDLKDTCILLLEHDLDKKERGQVDMEYLLKVLVHDWGFCYTFTTNLEKVKKFVLECDFMNNSQKKVVISRIDHMKSSIDGAPKSLQWKLRSKIGTKVRWYKDVSQKENTY